MTTSGEAPLAPKASPDQRDAILGAMRAVAEAGDGSATEADRHALASANRYLFRQPEQLNTAALPATPPDRLAAVLARSGLTEEAVKYLTVIAFVSGQLDPRKIAAVLRYAEALGIHERYLDEITEAAQCRLQETLADMARCNMESITERPWPVDGHVNAWLLPYQGSAADPDLVKRFTALQTLGEGTFGHAFWFHFTRNGYAFPGDPQGLNATFSVPRDSTHVLTGYDTHPRGELLVSTFTAGMHRRYPMAGHVLPVIFSWHLNEQINPVARDAAGGLDPDEFWHAWTAGEASPVDTFAPTWDFWSQVDRPLADVRADLGIPAAGLDAMDTPTR